MLKKLIITFFTWYINRIIKKDFSSFSFIKIEIDRSKPILLLANHFSWWDGFLLFELNRSLLKKKFHVMVTEENYRTVWFLKYLGAFPIKKNSKQAFQSLEYAGELLNDPQNLVLIFPQGKLYSAQVEDVVFEKGLSHLINSSQKKFKYLFAATFVDYFAKRKPTVSCYLTLWEEGEQVAGLDVLKDAYNNHYQTSRQTQNRITV